MKKVREYVLTVELLDSYLDAALRNSLEIFAEASLLLEAGFFARSYFLSCSSIEESGKALQAFHAKGRNLKDGGIQSKLKKTFEDHGSKNLAGLASVFFINKETPPDEDTLNFIVDTSFHLQIGREKASYADINDNGKVTEPRAIVSEQNARDTLNLAHTVIESTKSYVSTNAPPETSTLQDKYFLIPIEKMSKMMHNRDFWDYILDRVRNGEAFDIMRFTVSYYEMYFCRNRQFCAGSS